MTNVLMNRVSPPETARICGSCTLCCKVMELPELAKPPGVWCVHREGPTGCKIHGAHPTSCKVFSCQWLLEPRLPHRFRPDQTKVVLHHDANGPGLIAFCDPNNPLAWKREPMFSFLKRQAVASWNQDSIVIAMAGRRTWLLTPKTEMDLGEVNGPLKVNKSPDGSATVKIGPAT